MLCDLFSIDRCAVLSQAFVLTAATESSYDEGALATSEGDQVSSQEAQLCVPDEVDIL